MPLELREPELGERELVQRELMQRQLVQPLRPGATSGPEQEPLRNRWLTPQLMQAQESVLAQELGLGPDAGSLPREQVVESRSVVAKGSRSPGHPHLEQHQGAGRFLSRCLPHTRHGLRQHHQVRAHRDAVRSRYPSQHR